MKASLHLFPGSDAFYSSAASPGSRDTDATRRRWPRLGPGLAGIGARQTDAGSPIWKFICGRLACIMDARITGSISSQRSKGEWMLSTFNSFSGSEMEGVAISDRGEGI